MSKLLIKSKRRRSRGSRRRGIPHMGSAGDAKVEDSTITVPFRVRFSTSFMSEAETLAEVLLSCATLGNRISALADTYLMCRPGAMRLRAYSPIVMGPPLATETEILSGFWAVAFSNPINTTAATSVDQLVDFPLYIEGSMADWKGMDLVVPRNFWKTTPNRWYYTQDNGDNENFQFGKLHSYTVSGGAEFAASVPALQMILEGEMQFREPIDGGINPQAFAKAGLEPPKNIDALRLKLAKKLIMSYDVQGPKDAIDLPPEVKELSDDVKKLDHSLEDSGSHKSWADITDEAESRERLARRVVLLRRNHLSASKVALSEKKA